MSTYGGFQLPKSLTLLEAGDTLDISEQISAKSKLQSLTASRVRRSNQSTPQLAINSNVNSASSSVSSH